MSKHISAFIDAFFNQAQSRHHHVQRTAYDEITWEAHRRTVEHRKDCACRGLLHWTSGQQRRLRLRVHEHEKIRRQGQWGRRHGHSYNSAYWKVCNEQKCLRMFGVAVRYYSSVFFRIWRTMILRFVYCCFLESYHLQLEYLFLENVYLAFCLSHVKTSGGVARPKIFGGTKFFGGAKCLTLDEQQYFCLGRHFSNHKMTRYAKNLGGWPSGPPGYAYGQDHNNVQVRRFFTRLRWLEDTL